MGRTGESETTPPAGEGNIAFGEVEAQQVRD
jgi:hypothetical protein